MQNHEEYSGAPNLSWDEIAIVRPYDDHADDFYDDTYEEPDDVEDLADFLESEEEEGAEEDLSLFLESEDPRDVPEAFTLLKRQAEVKARTAAVIEPRKPVTPPLERLFPFMAPAMAWSARDLKKREKATATPAPAPAPQPTNGLDEFQDWFKRGDEIQYPEAPVLTPEPPKPPKKSWWNRFVDKVDSAVEGFGRFLDKAVPTVSAAGLAVTLGTMATELTEFYKPAHAAPEKVAISTTPPPVMSVSVASTPVSVLEENAVQVTPVIQAKKPSSAAELNQALLEKRAEIVQAAGGTKARYLHSETAHIHLVNEMQKWGGYETVLAHPEVQKAKTTAEMINLVERYFGEKVADLVEANAAAMHQPA